MSANASAWAWDQSVEKNVKLLLLFLADSADRDGRGPKEVIDDAAAACGLDKATLRGHIDSLENRKLIKIDSSGSYKLPVTQPKRRAFRFD